MAVVSSAATGATPLPAFSVQTISPADGTVLSGDVVWRVRVANGRVRRVDFVVDGSRRWTDRRPPFVRTFSAAVLSRGRHTLKATATSRAGRRATTSVEIVVEKPVVYWGALMDGNDTYGSGYGDAPWDKNTWRRFEAAAGKQVSIVHWGTSLPPWRRTFNYFLSTQKSVRARSALSLMSMSTGSARLRDIAAGKYDSSLRTWAQEAAAWRQPFFLRFNWEMNGYWFPWGSSQSSSDFVAAWHRFHDIATAAGATNITWVWCPNVDPFGRFTPYSALYPGDAYVDWTCLDGYNQSSRGPWLDFSQLFLPSYEELLRLAPGKPIMIGETSSDEAGGSKASWITDALEIQLPRSFPRVKAFVWFNWRIYENGLWWPWPIESSSSSAAAFAAAISSPYYAAGGGFSPPPPGAKIQPLDD